MTSPHNFMRPSGDAAAVVGMPPDGPDRRYQLCRKPEKRMCAAPQRRSHISRTTWTWWPPRSLTSRWITTCAETPAAVCGPCESTPPPPMSRPSCGIWGRWTGSPYASTPVRLPPARSGGSSTTQPTSTECPAPAPRISSRPSPPRPTCRMWSPWFPPCTATGSLSCTVPSFWS